MIKRSFEKMLICILIFIILFNFLLTSVTYADNTTNETNTVVVTSSVEENEAKHDERLEENSSGLAGILLMLIRLSMYIPAMIANLETYAVAISAGKADTDPLSVFITPFDIIFNRFTLTDINIFTIDGLDPNGMVATIRTSVAMWFRVTTGVAIGFLVVIFLVILIRLAIQDDVAENKAKMKAAFTDWLVSVLLVIFMDIIVVLLVNINSMFVNAIKGVSSQDISAAVSAIQDVILSTSTGMLLGFGALFTYFGLTIITMIFLVRYIYRFFKVILLVVIAPLAPIPYAVNRMTDKKSGSSLQIWLFEIIDAVFTQIVHCIVYVCVVGVALQGFASNTEIKGLEALAPCTFAIFAMFFVWPAENLVRKIFGIKRSGGVTSIIRNVASGARETSTALASIQSGQTSGTSIIGGIMNNNNNTYNNGLPTDSSVPELGDSTVHTKPITTSENPILIGGSEIDPATGRPYNSSTIDASDAAFVDTILPGQRDAVDENGVPIALPSGRDEASDKLDGLTAIVAGLGTTVVDADSSEVVDSTLVETHEETYEETYEEAEIPAAVSLDGENEDDELTQKINEKLKEIHEDLKNQLSEILDTDKIKELETQIVQMIKEKLDGVDNPTAEELQQVIREVQSELQTQISTGDAEQDEKISNAIKGFATMSAIAVSQGYDIEVEKKAGDIIDVDADGAVIPADEIDGVVDETTGFIREAVSNELALVPATRDVAVDIATKNAIFTGEIDNEIDMSDTGLSEIVSRLATRSTSDYGNNFDKALRDAQKLIEKEGEASMASVDTFRSNPSVEAYSQLSKAGRTVVEMENMAAARGIAINATSSSTSAEQYMQASKTKITHTQGSEDVLAKLQAQKGGDQGNT